jgi:hypothetical protein
MYGMSEYLMIAHEIEKARLMSHKTREDHQRKEGTSAGSYARPSIRQGRRKRDE